ncbi:MAG TPA: penicillin acylase family protein [Chloroflexi bacterium]|nr:penicillin acylase family protein [Chloroflexota bacterium]
MRTIIRILIGLILVLALVLIGAFACIRNSLPKTSGRVKLAGLDGQLEIVRDKDGVPHIFAATDHDAFFAIGYVHAQDRMWQMEFQRRIGAGRLSEILGEATLDTDKFLRTLGTYRAAETAWPALSQESQSALTAYAAGVNAWLEEGHVLPVEFLILGVKPEPWTVYDSLVWSKMMSWDLGGNYDMELLRVKLAQALGPERAAQLLPAYPEDGTTILSQNELAPQTSDTLLDIDTQLQTLFHLRGLDVGSNNWVVSGKLTESGLPLLANDPHLGARIPSIWYLAEIQGENIHVIGITFPGLPILAAGHNEDIAWGVTNVGPDVQDLYVEQVNPKNLNQYKVNDKWVDMTIVEEPIYVKGEDEPILWAARSTRHGPLISDVSGSAPMPVAMRWTALAPDDTTMDGFFKLNYAANWEEFTQALSYYVAPSQNFVYADTKGNIGYYAPGRIPIRSKGQGLAPVPGWNDDYKWESWIPFDELPHAYNPEKGYIATANNKVISDEYPYFISAQWASPQRAQRISEMIEEMSSGSEKISVDDMAVIQADQHSAQIRELLPLLLQITPVDDRQKEALSYLQNWDGDTGKDSIATSIYQAWFRQLGPAVFEDDLRGDLYDDLAERVHETFLINIMTNENNVWCDNFLTTPSENCADIAQTALDRGLDDLEDRMGKNMSRWQWGNIHLTQYPHAPFSEVDALKRFFHREIANGGDKYTVNVAPPKYSNQENPYYQFHVPSYRQIVDLSAWNSSRFIHTTGQSGNVISPHYDDFIERHQAVEYLPMSFGRDHVTGDVLVMQPK